MPPGKQFEQSFKKSVPSNVLIYKFKDGTANFDGQKNDNVRFQAKNVCDFMMFNGRYLYLLELKSLKGKSIPFGNFRDNQIKELTKMQHFRNVIAGFIINFRDVAKRPGCRPKNWHYR